MIATVTYTHILQSKESTLRESAYNYLFHSYKYDCLTEISFKRVVTEEELPPEKCRPVFVMKPEPQVVTEGEWAKFCCRVIGNPRPRLMWIMNGRTIGPVSNQLNSLQ